MPLPTGTISASQVNTELARASTNLMTLNETPVRSLAQVPTGTISFQNLQGKSAVVPRKSITVSLTDVQGVNITSAHPQIAPQYVAGSSDITIQTSGTIGSTGGSAFTMSGFNPADTLTLNNTGYIVGFGGNGGGGSGAGGGGGPAMNLTGLARPVSINNQGVIGGGGGGGGGGGPNGATDPAARFNPRPLAQRNPFYSPWPGGGGGGGAGSPAGAGGPGNNPGGPGSLTNGGGGGGGVPFIIRPGAGGPTARAGNGGGGGPLGSGGGNGSPSSPSTINRAGGAGAGPGPAIAGTSKINWINVGTVYGPQSA